MSEIDPINFSKTQRIVLLIDLHPILHLQNPKSSYLIPLLNSAKLLLSFPPLSLSLSSFKLFFSSLSPHLSYSTLINLSIPSYNPNSLSFNSPNETLILLSNTLNFVLDLVDSSIPKSIPKGSIVSSSIFQVIHDYSWDLIDDDFNGDFCDLLGFVRSNLIVVFSPVCRSIKEVCDFMSIDYDNDDVFSDCDVFCDKFRGVFGHVRDAFVSRDIHLSWIDVRFSIDSGNGGEFDNVNECSSSRLTGLFQNGFKSLGWSFCSSGSIVLGSALVPFGLIYAKIGVSSNFWKLDDVMKKVHGQLNLGILDVSGKPMECKYCDLQLIELKMTRRRRIDGLLFAGKCEEARFELHEQCTGIWESLGEEVVKIDVKAVFRYSELVKIDEQTSDVVLIKELPTGLKKKKGDSTGEFFADRVLDLLSEEPGEVTKRNSPPLWEILLSFLYRNGYWALLDLTKANGGLITGVLKPFSFHSAFLYVLKNGICSQCGALNVLSELNIGQGSSEIGDRIAGFENSMNPLSGTNKSESRRKHKKRPKWYKDLSWSSFCKAVGRSCEMELEEAYFAKGLDTSKKLRFLKCWMKQVTKNSSSLPHILYAPKYLEKTEEKLFPLHERISIDGECAPKEPLQTEEAGGLQEAFFSNLSQRIQHGIITGVDLLSFAKRVISSCIYWLRQKLGPNNKEESRASIEKSDGNSYEGLVAGELIKLLLIDPKGVTGKHKDGKLSSKVQNTLSSKNSSEDKVRAYELQILFRMEILKSDIGAGIRDSVKHKFVKQICCLLELIQCNMEDGFFGDFNFNDYLGRTIRNRYSQNLGDIVHIIYDQMDLLLFDDDDDQSPNPLLNSEDSSQSGKVGNNDRGSEPNSTDDSFHSDDTDHDRKLVEAQERRVKALRFASSTRRAMPELQRVWAPKPPKVSLSKSNFFSRSKRKSRHKESHDVVCETPKSEAKKCLFPAGVNIDDEEYREPGSSSTGPVNRVLFQDDSWHHNWGL